MTDYITLEEWKTTSDLEGTTYKDEQAELAITAASRAIDDACNRRFYADSDANQVRYYPPASGRLVVFDDLATLTTFEVDTDGDGTYETWTHLTQFFLEPTNASADGVPWTRATTNPNSSAYFRGYLREVKITGKFGWAATPAAIAEATTILASRLLKRASEAPFGIAAFGIDAGAVRIARFDPDVATLIDPYRRLVV
jgi:hypothetical protein